MKSVSQLDKVKKRYLFLLSVLFFAVSFILLVMKVGFPYHRGLALGVYSASLILFCLSLRHHAQSLQRHGKRVKDGWRQNRNLCVSAIVFGVGAYLLWVLVPVERSPLLDLSDTELHQQIRRDRELILTLDANLREAYGEMQQQNLFAVQIGEMTPKLNQHIRDVWKRYVDAMYEFDIIKEQYKGFAQISIRKKPELHAKSFGIAFGAYVAQYRASLYLDELVSDNQFMQSLLNEPDQARGIPAGTYRNFQKRTVHPRTLLRYHAGVAYLRLMRDEMGNPGNIQEQLAEAIDHVDRKLVGKPQRFVDKPLIQLEAKAFEGWLPVQKKIALGMSHIRFKDRPNLIKRPLLEQIAPQLRPGDIMVQRRNWYATNLGIPGYWPHAALYLGSIEEMNTVFAGMEILAGQLPGEIIKNTYPERYAELTRVNESGDRPCIIEAIAPGVVLTTLVQSGGADALAVLRPNVSLEDTWQAILRALSYHGRPYDYNFDFATDSELVCSELVYKAYSGCKGLDLETVMINGRPLLPPNHLVIKFDREFDQPDRQLDLVVFLDGRENEGTAVVSDASALRASWNRPKWYLLQE